MKPSYQTWILPFLMIFIALNSKAQEKVDITTCDATSSGVICVSPADTLYELCVKLKPGPSTNKKYKLDWGDGKTDDITLDNDATAKHIYDLRSFIKVNCNSADAKFSIFIENATNANDNKGFRVTFNKKPQAEPIVNQACEGSAIRFDNRSCPSSGNVTYLWEFSDGRKSTDYVPNISFTDPNQTYTVKLTATSQNCGINSKEVSFKMSKLPVADFKTTGLTIANLDTVVCMSNGGILSMDGTISLDESQYQWSITGGSFTYISGNSGSGNIQIKFNESKTYSISLIARNACGNSKPLICKHRLVSEPQLSITPQLDDCEPIKYKLNNPNPQATYTFNGNPIGLTEEKDAGYATAPYIIGASLKYECGTKTARPDTFYIIQKQPVKITSFRDTTLCVGTNVVGLSASPGSGLWSGGLIENQGSNKVFNPSSTGTYELKYNLGTGKCATRDSIKVSVQGVSITANDESICQGQTKLPLKATPAGGTWTTSVCSGCIQNDTLSLAGISSIDFKLTYSVTAPVSGGKNCNAQKEISVKVGRPKADFDISGGCSGTNAQITNKSVGASSYQWFLNGGTSPISTANSPSFPLPSGTVTVKLIALAGGCNSDFSKQITVSTPPELLNFTPDKTTGCSPLPITFNISNAQRSDVNYQWDFGDGGTSNNYQPNAYTFRNQTAKDQEFTIKFTAKNTCGEQSRTQKITVRPLARAEIGVDSTIFRCSPASVKFSNRSTGNQAGSLWLWGDGKSITSSADTLSYKYSAKDTTKIYKVQLVVSNSCGKDTADVSITIYPENIKPLFTMSHTTACAGELVTFKDATVPKPNRWLWKFDNEDKSVLANPNYSFKIANRTYKITMIAYTACGYDSIQRNIAISAPPKVSFDLPVQFSCEGQSIKISNTSGSLNSFMWNFGDSSPLDSVNFSPNHSFRSIGNKTITLTGYGGNNKSCKNEFKKDISIRNKPTADFKIASSSDTLCSSETVYFENKSKDATRFTWYFEDGRQSNAANPQLSFKAGLHDITLVAHYENACRDSVYRNDYLAIDTCQIEIPEVFTPNGDNIGDYFTAYGTKGLKKIAFLRIWNRWGQILYEKTDFQPNIDLEGWDGKVRGTDIPQGEYIYELEAEFVGNKRRKFKNNFSLIR
jgi:gliding motility-associated-like protein